MRFSRIYRTVLLLLGLSLAGGAAALLNFSRVDNGPIRSVSMLPAAEPVPRSFFGLTLHRYPTTPWPVIPVGSLRTWDTTATWADIEPSAGTYNWSGLDALLEVAQRQGADVLFTLGRTPRWASAAPDVKAPYGPECAPPAKMEYWENFLRAVVAHTDGKIRLWETWNEPQSPDSLFYCGDISTMVELQRRTYEVLKAVEPGATVLSPSAVGGYGPGWMSRFLASGGGNYADVLAFHGYLGPHVDAEAFLEVAAKFKAVFAKNGQEKKPIWDTEAGWGENQWLPEPDQQAAFLAKFYLMHLSAGVERFYWYAYENDKWGTLWDRKNGLHTAGIAYREVHRWLEGAILSSPCAPDGGVWTCLLLRNNGYRALVLWSGAKSAQPHSMVVVPDRYRKIRDLRSRSYEITNHTVPISNSPVLVEDAGDFGQ